MRYQHCEVKLGSYELFRQDDAMQRQIWERVMRGLTMRRYWISSTPIASIWPSVLCSPGDNMFDCVENLVPGGTKGLRRLFPREAALPTG